MRLIQIARVRHAAVSVMDDDGAGKKVAGVIHESRLERAEWSPPVRAARPEVS
jgi:hypothetical protein